MRGMSGRFKTQVDQTTGRKFIVRPNGERIIEYWTSSIGRLGGLREFSAEFRDGTTIICRHGGALHTLLSYLNTGQWLNSYDERDLYNGAVTKTLLDGIRKTTKTTTKEHGG
jgi:hypothetical protein